MNENLLKNGLLDVWIDDMTPCLVHSQTEEVKETLALKIQSRKELKSFNERNGWRINWSKLPNEAEIFAVALKENREIQGLVAVINDTKAHGAYISWACTAPWNNKHDFNTQKYKGVGGHLFAIAVEQSINYGYNGVVFGFAANEDILRHYKEKFNAIHVGILHPYHFFIDEINAHSIMEVYDYEWIEC